jgi:hypothetical protein
LSVSFVGNAFLFVAVHKNQLLYVFVVVWQRDYY